MNEVDPAPMHVLISLYPGYGLGDSIQIGPVLRHLLKYRPDWIIDYQADEGKHQVGRGIARRTFPYRSSFPTPHYDLSVQICLYDTWANWGDRPNTRVSSTLHEVFGLPWDAECGEYSVLVTADAIRMAWQVLPPRAVALHYRGDSSPERKNLSHDQAALICDSIKRLNRYPLLLDWRNAWPTRHIPQVMTTGGYPFSQEWGRDAEMNCAVIAQCEAFVGIDSGPGKCASATSTPALIVWTGHHPAPFHDPAPNTTHLVPLGYHGLEPVCNDRGVVDFFEAHYKVRYYSGDPVPMIQRWLREALT